MIARSGRWVSLLAASSIALLLTACGSDSDEVSGPRSEGDDHAITQMSLEVPLEAAPPIVFAGDREKEYRLYAIEPDGSERTEITTEFAFSPAWSGDGERIAFVGSLAVPGSADDGHNHGDSEAEGTGDEPLDPVHGDIGVTDFRLGLLTAPAGSTQSEEAGEARGEPMYPTIDPRSKRILFQVTPGFTRSGADGKVRSAIDSVEPGQDGVSTVLQGRDSYYQPAWSPDGSELAVIVSRCSGKDCSQDLELYDRDLDRSEPVVEGGVAGTPAWSSDGEIAFSWVDEGKAGIWTVEPGESPRQVTSGKQDSGPSFSPDGERIVFGRDCDLYVVGTDGEGLRNLTRTPDECEITPAWRP